MEPCRGLDDTPQRLVPLLYLIDFFIRLFYIKLHLYIVQILMNVIQVVERTIEVVQDMLTVKIFKGVTNVSAMMDMKETQIIMDAT